MIPPGINVWTEGAYQVRMEQARVIADRCFPKDEKNHRRILRLAEGLSERLWITVRVLEAETIVSLMESMIRDGWPGDAPFEGPQT